MSGARRSWGALFATGALWAVLCAMLAAGGHRPSGPSPVGEHHYAAQAALIVPLLAAAAWFGGWASGRVLSAPPSALRAAAAFGLGVGLGPTLVLPDLLAWGVGGFSLLSRLAPVVAVGALVGLGSATAGALGRASTAGPGRVAAATALALVAEALVLAPFVR